ncbi:MAG: haloacid dehalogenase-like hydrolase [Gemmataceae bacterium]|nr:haloacid dehalogenase-like hydrolase [Gemmata sp.]MDW8197939.1 haloacid dehalogenase-like hydrolase [Gemmataceae bacterium]
MTMPHHLASAQSDAHEGPDRRPLEGFGPGGFEVVNPAVRRGPFRVALFDFDGTLSLLREGWPQIMVDRMLHHLRQQQLIREPEEDCAASLERFILALNGHPTMKQMERFAEEVRIRGGRAAPPADYLQDYLAALMATVRQRWENLARGQARTADWVVPATHRMLAQLQQRQVELYVASGTDEGQVRHEVDLLQLAAYVGDRVFAPARNDPNFRKRDVIARAIAEQNISGEQLIGFGDGVVETQEVKRVGGVAVGVASQPAGVRGVNAAKRATLIAAGADIIIPDYEQGEALLAWLWGS